MAHNEGERIKLIYREYQKKKPPDLYSPFRKENLQIIQERERVLLTMLAKTLGTSLTDKRVLDIGCGTGGTLLPMLQYGFQPKNCFGVDILEDSIKLAKTRLPNITFICGSAENETFEKNSFDIITMFTCLSSVLDDNIRRKICEQALASLRPGGWVLIYDFRVNNPFNPNVKAVTFSELKRYFYGCKRYSKTLTLLPQIGRTIGKISIFLCGLLAKIPFLRTHRMTVFQKPGE